MCIDPWTISTSDQRVRIQHLSPPFHLAARPLQPCREPHSFSFSFSLSLPISLPSRSLPFLFSRAPPRDNNYPFDSCARCSQSHDPSSCYFSLCPSISSMSKSICNRLFSSSPSPARLIDICLNCIRGTFN